MANDASVNETDAEPGFKYDDKTIIMENGDIVVLKNGTKIEQISIESFIRKLRESMRLIAKYNNLLIKKTDVYGCPGVCQGFLKSTWRRDKRCLMRKK